MKGYNLTSITRRKWTLGGFFLSTVIAIDPPIDISTHARVPADKLAVLHRVGERHESYQRAYITASINNAILTSSIPRTVRRHLCAIQRADGASPLR